jgi:cell division inhibitor SulA
MLRCVRKPELAVPEFVIEREIPGAGNLSDAQLREVSQKSVAVLQEMGTQIRWLHSYVTGDKVYCVYLAPDEETIREHARRVGLPANRISAVRRLLDPTSAE